MKGDEAANEEVQVVVFAPFGRDASVLKRIAEDHGMAAVAIEDLTELAHAIGNEAFVLVLTEESLRGKMIEVLRDGLRRQPVWASMPTLLLLDEVDRPSETLSLIRSLEPAIDCLIMQRPARGGEIGSALRRLVRDRQRQWQVRDQIIRYEEQQVHLKFLLRELDHRVKNVLAKVRAIVSLTSRQATDLSTFVTSFSDRIQALSRAHEALAGDYHEPATLRQLVQESLAPFLDQTASNATITGPRVLLWPQGALSLSMMLHELATNAAKYGAFSVGTGHVDVRWSVAEEAEARLLTLEWNESGGPELGPIERRGFGTLVIDRIAAQEMDGRVKMDFARTGLHVTAIIPLPPADSIRAAL
ncbi:Two-component sensor histidine kinase, contains HisKA and HATPase domains [Fulvimarina manganoxydans]|uniref:histidine kinase n=1 Tax=Fulvimarina manganoxydans TaxID=937218 RepID=A0A1W1ZQZ9_9HYPH|nr:sensor histidine kinase [Fulvimarina manganoxydans]SMC50491.1 Two-component sensor histidine kinase, contains HisKA and HATPase domains [Fulvimarina manganoxydans]